MLKKTIVIFFFFITSAYAEVAKSIKVEGNNRISEETIKVYGDIQLGRDYSTIDLNEVLKRIYSTNFFEDVKLSLKNNVLNIVVKEYPLINSLDLQGEKSNTIKKSILEKLSLKENGSYISNKLNSDVALIKKLYASAGYNFANVETKIQNFTNNRLNVLFILDKGKKTYISKINFIGDKKLRDGRLRDVIVSEEYKFWKFISSNVYFNQANIELDKRLLTNYYKSLGYYDAQVLSSNAFINDNNESNLTYTINSGNRFKIKKISTNVDLLINKDVFKELESYYYELIGKYYSPFKVKKLLDEIDSLIVINDLQFLEHSINETIDPVTSSIDIQINIFEGKKELVEKVDIFGNTITDESVIRSELLLDEGDPFNLLKLDQSIARLKSRNLFGEVNSEIVEGSKKDQKIIKINVEEKPTGEISAGAGIGTNGGSFAFNVTENNWLGKGINVTTGVDVNSETFSGSLAFTDPNYNFSGNQLKYFIGNTKNDKPDSGYKNNIISTGIGTKFEQYRDIYLSPNLTFSYDNLEVKNNASSALKKQKGTFSDLSFDYSIINDKRDRVYGPTDGYLTNFSQTIPIYADAPFIKNSLGFNKYISFSDNMIGAVKFYAASINGLNNEDVRISKRLNLGSSRLRGFEYGKIGPKDGSDYIGGNYAASTNFELSLPNLLPESTRTDVGLFLDFGNVWHVDYASIDDSNKIRSSIGLNTDWISPVGPMSFIFSQNLSKADTDITESFNFKLGTTF